MHNNQGKKGKLLMRLDDGTVINRRVSLGHVRGLVAEESRKGRLEHWSFT